MRNLHLILAVLTTSLFVSPAMGQSFGSNTTAFRGMAAYIGFGFAEFTATEPAQIGSEFAMDDATTFYLAGEKQIGLTGLFITLNLQYMKIDGESFYDYTDLGGTNYFTNPGTEVDFTSEHTQLGLGLKFKLLPTSWFRPYGEGGGLFGFHKIQHRPAAGEIQNSDGGEKLEDTLTGFGYYLEAGIELDFTEVWSIKLNARYQQTETRPFETFNDQKIKYETRMFQVGFGRRF